MKFKESDPDSINSNEIIADYHFYLQLILEEKSLDFDSISLS